MPSPLIRHLTEQHDYPVADEHNIEKLLKQGECTVLFFTENPKHHPESNDVAVILPELMKRFSERMSVAVVDRNAEQALRARYPFNEWPALVFLRGEDYLGAVSRVQDWDVYLREFERLLNAEPVPAPRFKIPVVSESAGSCH
ncbi:MAG: hypothetical protein ABW116_07835 [Candidatus Sedimenticola sp. 20ELBAFRAG]